MDRIGSARLSEDLSISFPGVVVTYPADMVLNRGHQLALSIIHDSIDERPIFFAGENRFFTETTAAKGPLGVAKEDREKIFSSDALEELAPWPGGCRRKYYRDCRGSW